MDVYEKEYEELSYRVYVTDRMYTLMPSESQVQRWLDQISVLHERNTAEEVGDAEEAEIRQNLKDSYNRFIGKK